jgi:hypothetical protein
MAPGPWPSPRTSCTIIAARGRRTWKSRRRRRGGSLGMVLRVVGVEVLLMLRGQGLGVVMGEGEEWVEITSSSRNRNMSSVVWVME